MMKVVVTLTKCHTLPGSMTRFMALFLLFLVPVLAPVTFLPVMGGWITILLADRFLFPVIRRGQNLILDLEIPPFTEYRSRFPVAVQWEPQLFSRPVTLVCFPGPEFQPAELYFAEHTAIRMLRARKKGRFVLDRWYLKVNSRWGFFSLWYPLPIKAVLVVRNPLRRLEEKILHAIPAQTISSRQQGGQLEFHSLRSYRPGDPVRQIDWKKSARGTDIYLKLYEREEQQRVLFLLHTGMAVNYRWLTEDFLDYNLALVLALAGTVLRAYHHAGMILYSDRVHRVVAPAAGLKQLQLFRQVLGDIRSDSKTMPAPQMLSLLSPYIQPGYQVIILQPLTTVAEAEHFLPVVRQWRQHSRVLWLSAIRTSRIATPDSLLSHWQQIQEQHEAAQIRKILTGVNSAIIRERPEHCYRKFIAAWQRMELS